MTCTETLSPRATVHVPARGALRHSIDDLVQTLMSWQRRRHDRQLLRVMPEYLLRDVGLDTAEARFEADKPFWRA